jgi:hypothetical protein
MPLRRYRAEATPKVIVSPQAAIKDEVAPKYPKPKILVIDSPDVQDALARRPYDLRHACLSTWLNGGVPPTQVAEWAGHGVDVLLRIYANAS